MSDRKKYLLGFVRHLPINLKKNIPRKVEIISISQKLSKNINRKYRQKNKPTNVLSFRYGKNYGEILVCPDIIKKEAKLAGNTYKYQFTWMVVHGMLHLAGVHHERSEREAALADGIERRILQKQFKFSGKKNNNIA